MNNGIAQRHNVTKKKILFFEFLRGFVREKFKKV